jgi:hypothetical protein
MEIEQNPLFWRITRVFRELCFQAPATDVLPHPPHKKGREFVRTAAPGIFRP